MYSELPENDNANRAYQQQLKNAFVNGLKKELGGYITKYMVMYRTAGVLDVPWAKHSEKNLREKAKKNVKVKVFLQGEDGVGEEEEYTLEGRPPKPEKRMR